MNFNLIINIWFESNNLGFLKVFCEFDCWGIQLILEFAQFLWINLWGLKQIFDSVHGPEESLAQDQTS